MKKRLRNLLVLSSAALVLCASFASAPTEAPAEAPAQSPPKKHRIAVPEKLKKHARKIKALAKPVKKAVSKTAVVAAQEVTTVVKEAHSLGGKILQGIINVMIAASPGKTRVYLPAPSSDPNSGVTVGVLPVFLFVDKEEVVKHILAPSLTYNKIFKANATMRYYWYPKPGAQLFTIGSYAMETDRRITVRYEDSEFLRKWFYFKFDYTLQRDGSYRFSGFGPKSPEALESNLTFRDNRLQVLAGINLPGNLHLIVGNRVRYANAVDGPIDSLPKVSRFNPLPPGVDDPKTIVGQQFSFSYDSRDLPIAPIRGHYFNLYGEMTGRTGGDVRYERLGADLRGLYPFHNNRFVTGWRYVIEGENGGGTVPFYEQTLLGGKDSLRGFGDWRFVDRNKMSWSLEERVRFYTLNAFNVNVDFEVTPFYEAGEVYREREGFQLPDLHHVFGVGFRSVVRPNVVGVIDVGFSDQGTALFVGIDYPF